MICLYANFKVEIRNLISLVILRGTTVLRLKIPYKWNISASIIYQHELCAGYSKRETARLQPWSLMKFHEVFWSLEVYWFSIEGIHRSELKWCTYFRFERDLTVGNVPSSAIESGYTSTFSLGTWMWIWMEYNLFYRSTTLKKVETYTILKTKINRTLIKLKNYWKMKIFQTSNETLLE